VRIAIITPAARGTRTGNLHTAQRWAAMLRAAGHQVALQNSWTPDDRTELLLALHARRSHASIAEFARRHPDRRLVVALTGTDLYRDVGRSASARASLQAAQRLIALQPRAARELESSLRRKLHVVVQSSATRLVHRPVQRGLRVCVIGHLRREKDPLRTAAALAHVPRGEDIRVVQLGAAIDESLAARARRLMRKEPRYRWIGTVSHARALAWLAASHLMVISSLMEGGANVVSEALRIGVPVLASRIPGNVGLLGEDYPGYFAPGDDRALARLLRRAARDADFLALLERRVARLRDMVAPQREAASLLAALGIQPLRPQPPSSMRRTGAKVRR
jgi:putative glycosyltransferase (TIGR04348 family)